jgi:pimeloyl-ACP methyl ester carboxylesterase
VADLAIRDVGAGLVEEPVYFSAGDEVLFGIRTRPVAGGSDAGVVLVHNGPYNMTAHQNRMWVKLCRSAGHAGLSSLRFDLTGTGDSSGVAHERSATAQALTDTLAAIDFLRQGGAQRVAVVGTCRGALVALHAAARTAGLVGALLGGSPPLAEITDEQLGLLSWQATTVREAVAGAVSVDVARRLVTDREYRSWVVSRGRRRLSSVLARGRPAPATAARDVPYPLLDDFQALIAQRTPVKVVFAEADSQYQQFLAVREGLIGQIIDQPGTTVDVEVLPGHLHEFTTVESQDRFVELVLSWLVTVCDQS